MSEQLEAHGKQSAHPAQQPQQPEQEQIVAGVPENIYPGYEKVTDEQYHQQPYHYNAAKGYSQRGTRNGNPAKQGQPRGGRYGSNKYNYNVNSNSPSGQFNRFNEAAGGGHARNYNSNGYKPHRRNINPAAMNMQWQGYYNPQMYYMAPQLAPGNASAATSMEMPQSTSPIQTHASSASPPATRKIEITTKTGEHLDLNSLHSHNTHAILHNGTHQGFETKTPGSATRITENVTESDKIPETALNEKRNENILNPTEKGITEAEKTKREFLEQIKQRKAALERKKLEQFEALKTKTTEKEVTLESNEKERKDAPFSVSEKDLDTNDTLSPIFQETEKTSKDEKQLLSEATVSMNEQKVSAIDEEILSTQLVNSKEPIQAAVKQENVTEEQNKDQKPADIETESQSASKGASEVKVAANEENEESTVIGNLDTKDLETPVDDAKTESEDAEIKAEGAKSAVDDTKPEEPENKADTSDVVADITMTELLEKLDKAKPIEDIYSFMYPAGVDLPDPKYQKSHIKYTYGPTFLLQFKDRIKTAADEEWVKKAASKIVIPPGMNKAGKQRDGGSFGGPGGRMNGSDFRKSGSMRNMDGRSNSRNSSKKKSKRMLDDRRSNRSYTSRRDRERAEMERKEAEKPKEEVAPLVPSANRWVPKSKQQKNEKRMAPDGVTQLLEKDEVERKMKSLLNKLTLEMFDKISSDILTIAHQSKWENKGETLGIVIEQIFIKACDEPHWSSMYAQLCGKVVKELDPDIMDENNEGKTGPKLVLHYLVARCHAEFDKGWTDKLPTNEDGTPLEPEMMSDEYYKAATAKRRGLGLVRFIGFLYRLNLLTGKMMFECFRRLMKDLSNNPSEETLESVIELLSTVGEQFETDSFSAGQATLEGSALLDSLFASLQGITESETISSRMKFKLIDMKELRDKHWNSNKKEDGPKTIQQIHEEEKERQQRKSNSRSNSRRVNNSMGGRNTSRREVPSVSKDNFITTRSSSLRHTQKPVQKEEQRQPQMTATNIFNALMDDDDE